MIIAGCRAHCLCRCGGVQSLELQGRTFKCFQNPLQSHFLPAGEAPESPKSGSGQEEPRAGGLLSDPLAPMPARPLGW